MSISNLFKGQVLTNDQQELLTELEYFLETNDAPVFLLKGYAGTGKSFVMAGVTRYLDARGTEFTIVAPTGKAAKVIANKTKYLATTIHRAIYRFYEEDKEPKSESSTENPEKHYSLINENNDAFDAVYIVDESSMISDTYCGSEKGTFGSGFLLRDLLEYIDLEHNPYRKIIFIGDNAQLPPIRGIDSPALNQNMFKVVYNLSCESFELTEVVRQKSESGVMKNAQFLRNVTNSGALQKFEFDTSSDDVYKLPGKAFINKYFEICQGKVERTDELVIIARSNMLAKEYNSEIRARLFYSEAPLQLNEKVMCIRNYYTSNIFVSNGEFGRITKISPKPECRTVKVKENTFNGIEVHTVDLRFVDIEVEFMDDYGQPHLLKEKVLLNLFFHPFSQLDGLLYKALHTDLLIRYNKIYKAKGLVYKELKAIDPYWNVLQLKFGYAMTCHKSQGSEWKHVFVNTYNNGNIIKDPQWLYTAITRTSGNLYIN